MIFEAHDSDDSDIKKTVQKLNGFVFSKIILSVQHKMTGSDHPE